MSILSRSPFLAVAVLCCVSIDPARAQCFDWQSGFEGSGTHGLPYTVRAMASFDDGSGLALYAAGDFYTVGDALCRGIAKWNGVDWSPLGSGLIQAGGYAGKVNALQVFDDGDGAHLYAAGNFVSTGSGTPMSNLAKWDGASWSPVGGGTDDEVHALEVFDDGGGPALYVGGEFNSVGGAPAARLAKWNGSTWSSVASAMTAPSGAAVVYGLTVHDDGSGAALYVCGKFDSVDSIAAANVARWNGTSWIALGAGCDASAFAMASYDDGSGSGAELYLGGVFGMSGATQVDGIAKWNGSTWSALPGSMGAVGVSSTVEVLHVFDVGGGAELYVGGYFSTAGGLNVRSIARWSSSGWSVTGLAPGPTSTPGSLLVPTIESFATFDDGSPGGPQLYVGGSFHEFNGIASHGIARWNALGWDYVDIGQGPNQNVYAFCRFDDGSGEKLIVAGSFDHVGSLASSHIAAWDGSSWWSIGHGGTTDGRIRDLIVWDAGGGPALYACGDFTVIDGVPALRIARWDGTSWSALAGGGLAGSMSVAGNAMAIYDDGGGPALFVTGRFTTAGGLGALRVAKWNGASWSALGTGLTAGGEALTVYDDGLGGGPQLIVGGNFANAGGSPARYVARWNGTSWSALGSGATNGVFSLVVHDDGSGPALYAGGEFFPSGSFPGNCVARWDGAQWSAVGTPGYYVNALMEFDFGGSLGTQLVAAGGSLFSYPAGIKRWNGAQWTQLGGGLDYPAYALGKFDAGASDELYAGGEFTRSGSFVANYFARWARRCDCAPVVYCTAGTTSTGCVPAISASGAASASAGFGFTIAINGVEGQKPGLIFYGTSGRHDSPWGGGSTSFLCVKAPTQRTATQNSGGTSGGCDGVLVLDWNQYVATHPSGLGHPFSGGETVCAQAWFRDPPASKTTNLSNALEFQVCP